MTHPRTQALIDLHTKPAARQNPSHGIAASRASAAAPRPCAPTEQPYAPSRMYACSTRHCGSWVELAPTAPLPDDWITVTIAAERGRAARVGYRCGKCQRRQLVMSLLSDDLALKTLTRHDARRLAAWCERAGLDARGIRIVIGRLQAARGSEAWARMVARYMADMEDEG